jgi:hypothetical protein
MNQNDSNYNIIRSWLELVEALARLNRGLNQRFFNSTQCQHCLAAFRELNRLIEKFGGYFAAIFRQRLHDFFVQPHVHGGGVAFVTIKAQFVRQLAPLGQA